MEKGLKTQVKELVDQYLDTDSIRFIYEDIYRNGDKRFKFTGLKVDDYLLEEMQELIGEKLTDTKGIVWTVVKVYRDADYVKNPVSAAGEPWSGPLCIRISKQ